jgi:phage-related protein
MLDLNLQDNNEITDYESFNDFIDNYKDETFEYIIENYHNIKNKVENFDDYVKSVLSKIENMKSDLMIKSKYHQVKNLYFFFVSITNEHDELLIEWHKNKKNEIINDLNIIYNVSRHDEVVEHKSIIA